MFRASYFSWFCAFAAFQLALSSSFGLTVTIDNSYAGIPGHRVTWTDANGNTRSALMIDANASGTGGYMRQYTYVVVGGSQNGQTRTCTGTQDFTNGGNEEFSGEGFIQNHSTYNAGGGNYQDGDDSSNGQPANFAIALGGSSHAIFTYDMPGYTIRGITVPSTIQWFFADGRNDPLFTVSQDSRGAGGDLGADTRTPYGDMNFDGDTNEQNGGTVGGFSYGDTFKFVTLASAGGSESTTVTESSAWKATQANTVPYAMNWTTPSQADAELGHVATVPGSLIDQGQDTETSSFDGDLFDPRNKTGSKLPELSGSGGPSGNYEPQTMGFQTIDEQLADATDPVQYDRKLAWGSNFGRVGGFDNYGSANDVFNYSNHWSDQINSPLSGPRQTGLLTSYSVFVVFGPHLGSYLTGTVGSMVTQMENNAAASLSAATGSVRTSGPQGVGNASSTSFTYTPAGYNPVYATWEVNSSSNSADTTLTPAGGKSIKNPVFVIDNYTLGSLPTSISLNGTVATSGTDYYVSVDPGSSKLWITVKRTVSSALRLTVVAPATPPPTPTPTPNPTPTTAPAPPPYTVTNISPSSSTPGSLTYAINQAQATGVFHSIEFAIPGPGPFVIPVSAPILIAYPINLDGPSQAGYNGSPIITLDGQGNSTILQLGGVNNNTNTIAGISFVNFSQSAISISTGSIGNFIQNNWIGFKQLPTGGYITNASLGFGSSIGVSVLSSYNTIRANTISGVNQGIVFGDPITVTTEASPIYTSNDVQGNYIGTDPTGKALINGTYGNTDDGVYFGSGAGYTFIGPNNIISGNQGNGINMLDSGVISASPLQLAVQGNVVFQNTVGLGVDGTTALPNGGIGISVANSSYFNAIGGPFGGNYVACNASAGVAVGSSSTPAYSIFVQNNIIGCTANQVAAPSSGQLYGVAVSGSVGVVITGNVVVGSSGNGVSTYYSSYVNVSNNWIGQTATGVTIPNAGCGIFLNEIFNSYITGNSYGQNNFANLYQVNSANNTIN